MDKPRNRVTARRLDGARNRNRTGTTVRSRDFKSLVSTYFTIRAGGANYTFPRLSRHERKKGKVHCALSIFDLEREKSLELSTYTLARYRSTN